MNQLKSVFALVATLALAACAAPPTAVAPGLTPPEPKTCVTSMRQGVLLKDLEVKCPGYLSVVSPDDSFEFFKESDRIKIDELDVDTSQAVFRMRDRVAVVPIGGVLHFGDIPLAYLAAISQTEVLLFVPIETRYSTVVAYDKPTTAFTGGRGLFGTLGTIRRVHLDECFSAKDHGIMSKNSLGHIENGEAIFNYTPGHLPTRVGDDVMTWSSGIDGLRVALMLGTIQNRADIKDDSALLFWYENTYADCGPRHK